MIDIVMTPDDGKDGQDTCRIALMPSGRQGGVRRGANLLRASQELGVELESICGGRQTCGKCQVIVESGNFPKLGIHSSPDHLTSPTPAESEFIADFSTGRRLACAAEVAGDLLLTVPEESQARKQIIAKAASDRVIEVDPAVRQVYVEVQAAELADTGGDWERLHSALKDQWGLADLSIDLRALASLQSTLREGNFAVTVTVWQEREVLRVQPGYREGVYGLAVDVGSTTIVAHLCDLRTGAVLSTQAAMNPQVRYGEDLMSRVSYATHEPQGMARLHRMVIRTLNELAEKAAAEAGLAVSDILDAVIVGNTVMHHILVGLPPKELGEAPFALAIDAALDLKARDLGLELNPAARVHTLPLIAGHVGADNVAVQLAEAPHDQEKITLIVDVGTNAEIVLGNKEGVLVTSSPTGPAFEGAQITHGQRAAPGAIERVRIDPQTLEPSYKVIGYNEWILPGSAACLPDYAKATGICGSGIIEAIAELYLAAILNSAGLFQESATARTSRLRYRGRSAEYILADADLTATGAPIIIAQNDVRAIQLAKAALYAGARLLMSQRGVERVEQVILAGAFGSYISPFHALALGLIPDCGMENIHAVGNAAGDGARIALLNRELRHKASIMAHQVEHVSIPLDPTFQDEFVAAMNLPHARDPFPSLDGRLPVVEEAVSARTRRRERNRVTGESLKST